MSRVVALVEGQTEQGFIEEVVAPWMGGKGVYLTARIVGKPGHKGGVGEYQRARKDMLLLLKQDRGTTVTTMFDFYGMPASWPGRSQAAAVPFPQKAAVIERLLKDDIVAELGGSYETRFLPYIQMHEFEALLFSQPRTICEVLLCPGLQGKCQAIRDAFSTPEEINDGPQSAPSKRLEGLFRGYRKRLHGLIAAKRIGIEVIQSECPHFAAWVSTLVQLSGQDG